jgi:hypothetical protein
LQRLDVIHAGEQTFQLATKVRAVPITKLLNDINLL